MPSKPQGSMKNPASRPFSGVGAAEAVAEGGNPIVDVVDCAMLLALPVILAGEERTRGPIRKTGALECNRPGKTVRGKHGKVTGILWPALRENVFGLAEEREIQPSTHALSITR